MKIYIYPQNLKATASLWLWGLRDFAVICVALIVSVLVMTQVQIFLPFALTAAFAFLSIRLEDMTVLDYVKFAGRFLITSQQAYFWRAV